MLESVRRGKISARNEVVSTATGIRLMTNRITPPRFCNANPACLPAITQQMRCLFLLLALPAVAADYYVSPFGSDSAAGTPAQPWKTVNRALTGRAPGDVVHLQAGAVFTENVTVAAGGAAGLPVTLTSDPSNRATIKQSLATKSAVFIYNKGYITLENLIVTGVGRSLTTKMGIEAYADSGM